MKSSFSRLLFGFSAWVLLLSSLSFVGVDHVFAYTNYNGCVSGRSVAMAPNGGLSDAELTQIENSCNAEFPGQRASSANSDTLVQGRAPSSSSTTTTSTPAATSTANAVSTSSSTPASSSSSPSVHPTASSYVTSSSPNSTATRSGDVPASMFTDHADPNSIFRAPPTGANTDGSTLGQYAQPLIRLGDRQLAFQIIVNFFLGIISVVALLFLVFNGYRYAMSRGEDSQISQAKKGIIYSVIGLIVVLAAYTIVATVLNFGAQSSSPGIGVSVGVRL